MPRRRVGRSGRRVINLSVKGYKEESMGVEVAFVCGYSGGVGWIWVSFERHLSVGYHSVTILCRYDDLDSEFYDAILKVICSDNLDMFYHRSLCKPSARSKRYATS